MKEGIHPDYREVLFVDMSIDWALGGIMTRPGLDLVTRELVVIAACVTLGHPVTQLRAHAHAALAAGATREEIIEAILQLMFYAGGAAVPNAKITVESVATHQIRSSQSSSSGEYSFTAYIEEEFPAMAQTPEYDGMAYAAELMLVLNERSSP